jgi:TonB family protein
MLHGSEAYFRERASARRRVAATAAVLGAALFALLLATLAPPFKKNIEHLDLMVRFGYLSDQEHVVRRILLEADPGPDRALRDVGHVSVRPAQKGGAPTPISRPSVARPETRPPVIGPGESFEDRVARALARHSDVPLVMPDQLVVEKLVRPLYPEDAREKNIEGRVAVLALVDTSGAVADVSLVSPSGYEPLDRAAITAVWQCRFRPYHEDGAAKEVYVVIPFNFTIY